MRTFGTRAVLKMPWLLGMLNARGVRAAKANDDQRNAAAVLRVLVEFYIQVDLLVLITVRYKLSHTHGLM